MKKYMLIGLILSLLILSMIGIVYSQCGIDSEIDKQKLCVCYQAICFNGTEFKEVTHCGTFNSFENKIQAVCGK